MKQKTGLKIMLNRKKKFERNQFTAELILLNYYFRLNFNIFLFFLYDFGNLTNKKHFVIFEMFRNCCFFLLRITETIAMNFYLSLPATIYER